MLLRILVVPHSRYHLALGGDYPGCIFFYLSCPRAGQGRITGNTTDWLCDTFDIGRLLRCSHYENLNTALQRIH